MENRFHTPNWVKRHYFNFRNYEKVPESAIQKIKKGLEKFIITEPVVSIVIPAYNEEENLLSTLSSFAELQPAVPTELLVVNNLTGRPTERRRSWTIVVCDPYINLYRVEPMPGNWGWKQPGVKLF